MNISVECVVFGYGAQDINILLRKRSLNMHDKKYPVLDDWLLTGDYIFKSETLDQAASRIFTNVTREKNVRTRQFRTFGNPQRIQNEKDSLFANSEGVKLRTLSVVYYFLLPINKVEIVDKEKLRWFSVKCLPKIGFDHKEIIHKTLEYLQEKAILEPIIFEFLPEKFTINELHTVFETVFEIEIDNRNFRKKALKKAFIVPLREKRTGVSKKPAQYYMFSEDIYAKTKGSNEMIKCP